MTIIFEYVTAPTTETVHLVRQDASEQMTETLCGRPTRDMRPGDETLSGIAATCSTCRKIVRKS